MDKDVCISEHLKQRKKMFQEALLIISAFLTIFVSALDIPTYQHPTIKEQPCFECPPGFRIQGIDVDAKKCPITPDNSPSFPQCVLCPDGYYSAKWGTLHYCKEQNLCDEDWQYMSYEGDTTQPNICGCKYGINEDLSCKTSPEVLSSCPVQPTKKCPEAKAEPTTNCPTLLAPTTEKHLTASPCIQVTSTQQSACQDNTIMAVGITICVFVLLDIIGALCYYCLCVKKGCKDKLKYSSHSNTTESKAFIGPKKTPNKDLLSEAIRYIEKSVTDSLTFMRDGLLFEPPDYHSCTVVQNMRETNLNALHLWKSRQASPTVLDLVEALERCSMNEIANYVRINYMSNDRRPTTNRQESGWRVAMPPEEPLFEVCLS